MSKLADFLTNGGPAFPVRSVPLEEGGQFFAAGMSLRDWFAGQALAGLLASPVTDDMSWSEIASKAYNAANSMLAERAKAQP